MNAGKSTYLLQVAHNYQENKKTVLLFTAAVDNRDGVGVISSRIGLRKSALTFDANTDFNEALKDFDGACVLIDEAQFLTPLQVKTLHRWVHQKGVPVMCFGLRSDFKGNAFPGSAELLTLADDLDEIVTICACGKRATMNLRLDEEGRPVAEGNQIEIGGNSRYRQVCAKCFYREAH